jgi:hypothetical protein
MLRALEIGDRAGIAIAVACAAHCLVAPAFAASIQVAGTLASDQAEWMFLGSSLVVSGVTVVASCMRGVARRAVLIAFLTGAGLLLVGRLGGSRAETIELPLVALGAGTIVAAHLLNLFQCRCRKGNTSCVAIE